MVKRLSNSIKCQLNHLYQKGGGGKEEEVAAEEAQGQEGEQK